MAFGLYAAIPTTASASAVYQVGPARVYKTIAAAAAVAPSGSVIEIDAGTYAGNDALLYLSESENKTLTIRGVGEVILSAAGKSTGGKGIFVVDGGEVTIENITFRDATVPDGNGAGIRLGDGRLVVRNSIFLYNENGILAGNLSTTTVELYHNEFGYSTSTTTPGYTHNIYIGRVGSLIAEGNYFHDAGAGHLFKSRAAVNIIRYNRFSEENEGGNWHASYELDLPNGGQALVVGNTFGKVTRDQNSNIMTFGSEGLSGNDHLYMAYNTFLSGITPSQLLVLASGATVVWQNNLWQDHLTLADTLIAQGVHGNAAFSAGQLEPNLLPNPALQASLANTVVPLSDAVLPVEITALGGSLTPTRQYKHPMTTEAIGAPVLPGAMQDLEVVAPTDPDGNDGTDPGNNGNGGNNGTDPGNNGNGGNNGTDPGNNGTGGNNDNGTDGTANISGADNAVNKVDNNDGGKISFRKPTANGSVSFTVGNSKLTYTGKNLTNKITVKANGKTLKKGTDYTVTYKNNKNIGTASALITGIGAYCDTKTIKFKIVPNKTSGVKVTVGKKQIKVTWKKVPAAQKITKYEVRYQIKGTSDRKTKFVAAKKSALTIKNLKKGKTYQIRIRSYKTVKGVKYYSEWSKAKLLRTRSLRSL
jgi:hypothetical protein